jgi:hypothetical protein
MRLISFDVGIKNMAYCIFDIDTNKVFSIIDWNIMNLMNESNTIIHTCSCHLKPKSKKNIGNPSPCKSKAKYTKNGKYYCDKHAKTCEFLPYSKACSQPSLKKMKVDDLNQKYKECFGVFCAGSLEKLRFSDRSVPEQNHHSTQGFASQNRCCNPLLSMANLPMTKVSMLRTFEEKMLELIPKPKEKSASETDLITIGKNMSVLLDTIPNLGMITHVIIENQISPLANRMKTIQGMLAQYFIIKGSPILHIEFVSSFNKLKDFTKAGESSDLTSILGMEKLDSRDSANPLSLCTGQGGPHSGSDALGHPKPEWRLSENRSSKNVGSPPIIRNEMKDNYKQHKKDSIVICQRFLDNNENLTKWKESAHFISLTKRDDLADCFLQGIWYMKNKKNIVYNENLQITSG